MGFLGNVKPDDPISLPKLNSLSPFQTELNSNPYYVHMAGKPNVMNQPTENAVQINYSDFVGTYGSIVGAGNIINTFGN